MTADEERRQQSGLGSPREGAAEEDHADPHAPHGERAEPRAVLHKEVVEEDRQEGAAGGEGAASGEQRQEAPEGHQGEKQPRRAAASERRRAGMGRCGAPTASRLRSRQSFAPMPKQ